MYFPRRGWLVGQLPLEVKLDTHSLLTKVGVPPTTGWILRSSALVLTSHPLWEMFPIRAEFLVAST
jgi:hypothetical protein